MKKNKIELKKIQITKLDNLKKFRIIGGRQQYDTLSQEPPCNISTDLINNEEIFTTGG